MDMSNKDMLILLKARGAMNLRVMKDITQVVLLNKHAAG